jgi:hypothetical protein
MPNPVADACADLVTVLSSVSGLDSDHVFVATDEKHLGEKIAVGVKTPFVGVVYGGLQSIAAADPSRMGRLIDMRFGLMFGLASGQIGNVNAASSAWDILKAVRAAIRGRKAPSGHPWRFVSEAYLGRRNEVLYYVQHWAAAVAEG